jgi:predicted nucleotidyltransferase/predicted transcriptional regulator
VNILQLLLENTGQQFTIKKIAESLKINYRIAHERVNVLEWEGLLKVKKAGNARLCEFSYTFNSKVYLAEYNRREALFRKDKNFAVLRQRLAELNFVFVVLVFGSHAKGTANKRSDIDLLTIGGNEKEIRSALSLLPENIHLTALSYDDFVRMAKSKEFTVVSEAMKNNIIIMGIEEYYRVLTHARQTQN